MPDNIPAPSGRDEAAQCPSCTISDLEMLAWNYAVDLTEEYDSETARGASETLVELAKLYRKTKNALSEKQMQYNRLMHIVKIAIGEGYVARTNYPVELLEAYVEAVEGGKSRVDFNDLIETVAGKGIGYGAKGAGRE